MTSNYSQQYQQIAIEIDQLKLTGDAKEEEVRLITEKVCNLENPSELSSSFEILLSKLGDNTDAFNALAKQIAEFTKGQEDIQTARLEFMEFYQRTINNSNAHNAMIAQSPDVIKHMAEKDIYYAKLTFKELLDTAEGDSKTLNNILEQFKNYAKEKMTTNANSSYLLLDVMTNILFYKSASPSIATKSILSPFFTVIAEGNGRKDITYLIKNNKNETMAITKNKAINANVKDYRTNEEFQTVLTAFNNISDDSSEQKTLPDNNNYAMEFMTYELFE